MAGQAAESEFNARRKSPTRQKLDFPILIGFGTIPALQYRQPVTLEIPPHACSIIGSRTRASSGKVLRTSAPGAFFFVSISNLL
jgi:hypothetical protein